MDDHQCDNDAGSRATDLVHLASALAVEAEVLAEVGVATNPVHPQNLEALVVASWPTPGALRSALDMLEDDADSATRRLLAGAALYSAFYGD
jgi:hypothetical protein